MSPLSPGNMFLFDPHSRSDSPPHIYVMVSADENGRGAEAWPLSPGETFMLVEAIANRHTSTSEWQVLSRGLVGSIYVTERDRRALRLVSHTSEESC